MLNKTMKEWVLFTTAAWWEKGPVNKISVEIHLSNMRSQPEKYLGRQSQSMSKTHLRSVPGASASVQTGGDSWEVREVGVEARDKAGWIIQL